MNTILTSITNWKIKKEEKNLISYMKRIKYEIRLGKPNRPMSTSPEKVEPILRVGP